MVKKELYVRGRKELLGSLYSGEREAESLLVQAWHRINSWRHNWCSWQNTATQQGQTMYFSASASLPLWGSWGAYEEWDLSTKEPLSFAESQTVCNLGWELFPMHLLSSLPQCTKTQAARGLDTHVRHSLFPTDPSWQPPRPVSLPSMAPLPQFCPKLACRLTPSFLSFVGLVLTRPVRILLNSLAVSPAYIRMNEKRLQREKELLENCELDFLAQKTIPHQQFRTEVPGKLTDAPVLGFLRT